MPSPLGFQGRKRPATILRIRLAATTPPDWNSRRSLFESKLREFVELLAQANGVDSAAASETHALDVRAVRRAEQRLAVEEPTPDDIAAYSRIINAFENMPATLVPVDSSKAGLADDLERVRRPLERLLQEVDAILVGGNSELLLLVANGVEEMADVLRSASGR